jgi:hypothetical protein
MPVAGGDRPNAIDINGLEVTTAVTGATVGVVSAGFTVASALVRTALRGKLIYLKLDLVWTAGSDDQRHLLGYRRQHRRHHVFHDRRGVPADGADLDDLFRQPWHG